MTPISRVMATDILCPAHAEISDCIVLANRYPDMPLVLSAYGSGNCSNTGSLLVYWNSFNAYARLQGGFLDHWHDHLLSTQHMSCTSSEGGCPSISRIYGAVPAEPMQCNWSSSVIASDGEAVVIAKPRLLEIKQCMKMFDSALSDVVFTTEVLVDSAANDYSIDLTVNASILISNYMDHDDIDKCMDFDVLLLINGILVCASHFIQQETSMVHRHRVWDEAGGKIDFQEVNGFSLFTLTLMGKRGDPYTFSVRGVHWPENMLLMPYNIDCLDSDTQSCTAAHTTLSLLEAHPSRWDILVISRSMTNTSWCDKGFPLGFKQLSISEEKVSSWRDGVWRVFGNRTSPTRDNEEGDPSKTDYAVSMRWSVDPLRDLPDIILRAGSVHRCSVFICIIMFHIICIMFQRDPVKKLEAAGLVTCRL